jgi:hypothetical protein
MTIEWKIARTMAHLWINHHYSGISVSLVKCVPTEETLKMLNMPSLPKKGE